MARAFDVVLMVGAAGCFIYAFASADPAWIGAGGALLGGEALARARGEVE